MARPSSILLSNGTVLLHDDEDRVNPVRADVLIIDGKIVEIAPSIAPLSPSPDALDIDCTGKIISPGFVDTHHHLWQTQLKGRHADDLLLDYMGKGNITFSLFKPEDVFWGELGGPTASVPDWASKQLAELAASQPFGDGRVRLGVGFDGYHLPQDVVVSVFESARRMGVKLFTSHYVRGALFGQHSVVNLLDAYGLLKSDILLSHASQALPEDAVQLIAEHAHISSTPDTELQMAHGAPVCFRTDLFQIASLGVDCHSNNSGDMLSQMRLALQSARGTRNQRFVAQGVLPRAAFNLGTIMGARAVGMGAEIGSIRVGKRADLVVFDAQSPGMVCAADHDPVAAIVLHASVRDVETLCPVDAGGGAEVGWPEEVIEGADMDGAKEAVMKLFHVDANKIVDHL
ncbi:hypothetical protein DFH09DRAFT_1158419 [Mycena vulgaris]|nr:hypothetical protein DFH09DRAFT_1158419 [Mycena vulgaris]